MTSHILLFNFFKCKNPHEIAIYDRLEQCNCSLSTCLHLGKTEDGGIPSGYPQTGINNNGYFQCPMLKAMPVMFFFYFLSNSKLHLNTFEFMSLKVFVVQSFSWSCTHTQLKLQNSSTKKMKSVVVLLPPGMLLKGWLTVVRSSLLSRFLPFISRWNN